MYIYMYIYLHTSGRHVATESTLEFSFNERSRSAYTERWGAGVETPKNVPEEIGGWGRVPFNEPYAPSLSTIYDGA